MNNTSGPITVSISGMTCNHCTDSVTEELMALDGVREVTITLNPNGISTATISAEHPLSGKEIGEAVAEAGYLLVSDDA